MTGDRIIFRSLPESLRISDRCVTINTDFRIGLLVRELWQDERISGHDGLGWELTFRLLFSDAENLLSWAFSHFGEVRDAVLWYMNDGKRETYPASVENGLPRRIFSCLWDETLLYPVFLRAYGIDLGALAPGEMHLWRFDALFADLPEDCLLLKTMAIRGQDGSSLDGDGARAMLAAKQVLVRIPEAKRIFDVLYAESGTGECGKKGDDEYGKRL